MKGEVVCVIAKDRAEALATLSAAKVDLRKALILQTVEDLPQRPARLLKGPWWFHSALAQEEAFHVWRTHYGDFRPRTLTL